MRDYQTKTNIVGSDTPAADYCNAGEFNSYAQELTNAVEAADLVPAIADGTAETFFQLAQAMSVHAMGGAEFHSCASGSGSNYILSPYGNRVTPPAYYNGMTVSFQADSANKTNVVTDVGGLGIQFIKTSTGSGNLLEGVIQAGQTIRMRYYTAPHNAFLLVNEGATIFVGTAGYQVFNSGLIVQWGLDTATSYLSGEPAEIPFSIPFPTAVFIMVGGNYKASWGGIPYDSGFYVSSLNGFKFSTAKTTGTEPQYWIAVGW